MMLIQHTKQYQIHNISTIYHKDCHINGNK